MLSDSYKKQIKEVKELKHLKNTLVQYMDISHKEQNIQKSQKHNER